MRGPLEFIKANRAAILAALAARELAPRMIWRSSERMAEIADESVQLVVTSPPYPMIQMWDASFAEQTGVDDTAKAFEAQHALLARVWAECARVLSPGGILAINIGDATRTADGAFRLYANHARAIHDCEQLGLQSLVPILWKKPTNKPNAFLGSGFLPPNAYVTLDCEFILIFRKGPPRQMPAKDPLRYASQFSKPERDAWFSQVWENVRGAAQDHAETAPFPAEIPYRLIRMFSCLGDTVLDPFAGSGETLRVARILGRRGVGYERNENLRPIVGSRVPPAALSADDIMARFVHLYRTTDGRLTASGEALALLEDRSME